MRYDWKLVLLFGFAVAPMTTATEFVVDDFDGGADARVEINGMFGTSAAITPDNSLNLSVGGAPGAFLTSNFDIFGRTNRLASFDFGDDSLGGVGNPNEFPPDPEMGLDGDTLGIVPFTGPAGRDDTDHFFGTNDLDNDDNPGGGGTAVWTIDISGLSNLSLSAVFSAMGDFEAGDNSHTFTASIDGGTAQTLFEIDSNTDATFEYTMESGVLVTLDDPLEITDSFGTRVIDNSFTTSATSLISGTGSELVITYTAGANNGGGEPFAFDNLVLSDEPIMMTDVDLDDDGDVDGADFLLIQRTNPSLIPDWIDQYPAGSLAGVTAVPEPSSIALFGLAAALMPLSRRSRRG